jgi:hypothetical protein
MWKRVPASCCPKGRQPAGLANIAFDQNFAAIKVPK